MITCPTCHNENRETAKFCDNCGQHLISGLKSNATQTAVTVPPASLINQLIPHELAAKLDAARRSGALAGERRVVTMLFCDVVGSTAASEQLDPEEWTEIMNGAYEQMITPIYRYEGTLARLLGDAILAFFGAPITHEDDPQRAILAGLEVIQRFQQYRQEVKSAWGIDLNVRVGINTGLVIVGNVGSDLHLEYTVMGDAVNLAARMEQTARPGTVQITEDTYQLVAPLFEFEALGKLRVKGKAEPVLSYRALRTKAAPARRPRGIAGLESPLIGREEEFATLQTAVDRVQQGTGGIIFLVGEAGLGKSRLIQELKATTANQSNGIRWYEMFSHSYESEQPYALFQQLIRQVAGVTMDDTPLMLREKFKDVYQALPDEDQAGISQVMESLFGLKNGAGDPALSGEAFKGRFYTMMGHLWRHWAEPGPLVLVADDLHWTDPASVGLLQYLLPLCDQAPLLLLLVMRPDREAPGWQLRQMVVENYPQRCTEIDLQPLSYDRSSLLVDNLLQITNLPPVLRERILGKSEGNPFFVEEVVRSLIDQGTIVRDENRGRWLVTSAGQNIDIPDNLLALLVARIDRLTENSRRTLQMASVVGRSFYYRLLDHIIKFTEGLDPQLLTLQRADMIREKSRTPELEYVFRHALTQEAAYSTLLHKQRRVFHRWVGEAIEALFVDQTEELAGELAGHFYQAGDFDKALNYYAAAGERAFLLHAAAEAIAHYKRAIACTGQVETTSEQLVHLYLRLGRAFELDNQFDSALSTYQDMVELADKRHDAALKLASLTAQCIIRATQTPLYDPGLAQILGEQALALAHELHDEEAAAKVLWGLLLVEQWGAGNMDKALTYGQRSLAIARELGLREQIGFTLTNLLMVYLNREELSAARAAGGEARNIWHELGNTPMLADGYNTAMWVETEAGDFDAALAMGAEGERLGRSIGSIWGQAGALNSMAVAYLEQGEIARSISSIREARRLAKAADIRPLVYFGLPYLTLAYLTVGAFAQADKYANQIYEKRDSLVHIYRRTSLAVSAEVKIRLGELERAQHILAEAFEGLNLDAPLSSVVRLLLADAYLQLAQENPERALERMAYLTNRMRQAGVRRYMPEGLWLQGKALLALNEPDSARAVLVEAGNVARNTGARRNLWQILWTLSQLETAADKALEAESYQLQAQEIITTIADQTGSEELRASFLALPEVQAVMAK